MTGSSWFIPAGEAPGSPRIAENPFAARSPREKRAIIDGLPVYRLLYRRADRAAASRA
jgi:tRNA (guanine-N7-)-methyltransferase